MSFIDFALSAVGWTVLVGIAIWLSQHLIVTRLRASVRHEFNEKLEMLRADLRKSEESFKADLRAKETQIEVLRSGALLGMTSRQTTLDKRRLEAVEQLWGGIEELGNLKTAAWFMSGFNFEKSSEIASENPRVREFFATIGQTFDPGKLQASDVNKSRPFVSEIARALFSAYQAIVLYAVVQLQMLKAGVKDAKLLTPDHVNKLTKAALPQYAGYIDTYGSSGYSSMLEPLEAELLKELQRMMRGEESDKATVEQAAKIMNEVASLNEEISKGSAGKVKTTSL